MKLMVLLVMSFSWCVAFSQNHSNGGNEIFLTQVTSTGDDDDERETPVFSDAPFVYSLLPQSPSAIMNGGIISISFKLLYADVSLSIKNELTGEVIYDSHYDSPSHVVVPLHGIDKGDYLLQIQTERDRWEGWFTW